ncbi:MAG TPA: hypothetical protein ENN99_14885 [Chloroflexi bacterium]|nr:hypothetical protein [Chloroflexota bacterium]
MGENILIDVSGWVGVVALLLAYVLVSTRKIEGDSSSYQLLNAVGSGLLILNSYYYGAYPSVAVNVVWIGIAVYTMMRVRSKTRSGSGTGCAGGPVEE